MSKSVKISGVTYSNVPSVQIPLATGSGNAEFFDVSDATLDSNSKLLSGVTAYGGNGTKYTGNIPTKAAATITPTTSNQEIAAGTYLTGKQTILGDANLVAGNIVDGVSIFGVTGSAQLVSVVQDNTTKVLTIS